MQKSLTLAMVAVAACVGVSGCGSMKKALGAEKSSPDEFRVVTKAPLVMPPDYALRPPRPGDARPQELRPTDQARAAVFGQDVGAGASAGERALVAKAGAEAVDPAVRTQVDVEAASLVHKDQGFADQILSFGATADAQKPLTPEEEKARLANMESVRRATGGGQVVIERKSSGKLPGL